ncbi:TetR/AcrR family transcriptional regulator [Lacticaseibacillus saniviri]|uniref:TetR/AcrR family transcriptional regulator n=1 Tax=Lacticaseibacillus saniviri TaxID=931533 RepID=UPI000AB4BD87|nr:TetR/AcrR family transcriptional regulator [Lacticaseibacillus saniviri]
MRTQDLEKRERILDSTEQIIRTDGIAAVSLSKIAKAANIAPGTLYTYFTDKNDMLRTLYLNRKKALAAAITTIDLANDPVQELNHFMDLVFDYGKQHLDDMLLIREFNQAAILKQLGITVQDAYAGFEVLATFVERATAQDVFVAINYDVLMAYAYTPRSGVSHCDNIRYH